MAFVATELSQFGQNGVGAQFSDLISTAVTPAGLGLFFYRNSADDDVTAANFFDGSALSQAPAGLVWVVEGGDTVTGGTLYTWTISAEVVTLVLVAPAAP